MPGDEYVLRGTLTGLVRQAGIFGLRDDDLEKAFISGEVDPNLKDIGMDSLSEMELCIGIENELGVSIVPAELEKLATLDAVVARIQQLQA